MKVWRIVLLRSLERTGGGQVRKNCLMKANCELSRESWECESKQHRTKILPLKRTGCDSLGNFKPH